MTWQGSSIAARYRRNFIIALTIHLKKIASIIIEDISTETEEKASRVPTDDVHIYRQRGVFVGMTGFTTTVEVYYIYALPDMVAVLLKHTLIILIPLSGLSSGVGGIVQGIFVNGFASRGGLDDSGGSTCLCLGGRRHVCNG